MSTKTPVKIPTITSIGNLSGLTLPGIEARLASIDLRRIPVGQRQLIREARVQVQALYRALIAAESVSLIREER